MTDGALPGTLRDEVVLMSRSAGLNQWLTELSLPSMHCGGCVNKVRNALERSPEVLSVQVNLTELRAVVCWKNQSAEQTNSNSVLFLQALADAGHPAKVIEPNRTQRNTRLQQLIRYLAVAGFCAANVMLFSLAIWFGAGPDLKPAFHWISAVIAMVALVYSGRVFFVSAWQALRQGTTNMDVPISIGVLLTYAMSLFDTIYGGDHVYFEATVTLLFFLLIGRTLDQMMRDRVRSVIDGIAQLAPPGANCENAHGTVEYRALSDIAVGTLIVVSAGERIAVDGNIEAGYSDVDESLVTGEENPRSVGPGAHLLAGTINLTGSLRLRSTDTASDSFLAKILELVRAAESTRPKYRRLADRVAQLYAPFVHGLAAFGFIAWWLAAGDIYQAMTIAVAVLIITCPCALGLAVPMVQVIAARRLLEHGILIKDGAAMERLCEIDTVIFDKTGTLTSGHAQLKHRPNHRSPFLVLAGAMGQYSQHPYSQALAQAASHQRTTVKLASRVSETPGHGLETNHEGVTYRLGKPSWAMSECHQQLHHETFDTRVDSPVVLTANGELRASFDFEDPMREDAVRAVQQLRQSDFEIRMLSGDTPARVESLAMRLNIDNCQGSALPADKLVAVQSLASDAKRVLMVGDGLNDVAALSAAHVSMAPESAADVSRSAADFVFLGASLNAVPLAVTIAKRADRLIRQNFALAIGYNIIAVPAALLGFITPWVAAIAMSASSAIVIANAMRLSACRHQQQRSYQTSSPVTNLERDID